MELNSSISVNEERFQHNIQPKSVNKYKGELCNAKERKGRVLRGIDVTSVLYYPFGTENAPEVKINISSSGS